MLIDMAELIGCNNIFQMVDDYKKEIKWKDNIILKGDENALLKGEDF